MGTEARMRDDVHGNDLVGRAGEAFGGGGESAIDEGIPNVALDHTGTRLDPFSILPDELVAKIFETYVEDWESKWAEPMHDLMDFLDTIIVVSRRWRFIALHAPRLWRNIVYRPEWQSGWQTRPEQCLRRSKATLLTVYYTVRKDVRDLSVLLRTRVGSRLRSLVLSDALDQSYCDMVLFTISKAELPRLEALSLDNFLEVQVTLLLELLRRKTRLRRLSLGKVSLIGAAGGEAVALPQLEALYLLEMNGRSMDIILSSLSLSRSLRLVLWHANGIYNVYDYDVTQSGVHLFGLVRELTVGLASRETSVLLEILRRTTNLEELIVFQSSGAPVNVNSTLDALSHSRTSDARIIPHLHTIAFHSVTVSVEALLHFVDRRSQPGSEPIRRIGIGRKAQNHMPESELQKLVNKVEIFEWRPEQL